MWKALRNCLSLVDHRERHWVALLTFTSLVTFLLEFCGALAIVRLLCLLSGAERPQDDSLLHHFLPGESRLAFWLTLIGTVYLAKNLIRLGDLYFRGVFVERVLSTLSRRILRSHLNAPFEEHLQSHTSTIIRCLTKDVDEVAREVLLAALAMCAEFTIVMGLVGMLLIAAPGTSLAVAGITLAFTFLLLVIAKRAEIGWGQQYTMASGKLLKHLQETLSHPALVMLTQCEGIVEEQFVRIRRTFGNVIRHRTIIQTWPAIALELLLVTGLLSTIAWLAYGDRLEDVFPILGMFAYAGLRLLPALGKTMAMAATIRASSDLIAALCVTVSTDERTAVDHAAPYRQLTLQQQICFEQVAYTYPNRDGSGVKDISLRIYRGETVAIMGESGVGKTTLIYLLLGLLSPKSGRILIDGRDLQSNLRSWQTQIGYVPQVPNLYATTIAENIACGFAATEMDTARMNEAVRQAQLTSWLDTLPDGLQTQVGETGQQISGGQRQRIALASALYRRPELLILDEPTSGLDSETERAVRGAVLKSAVGRTCVIVTHQPETASACDRIIRLP